MTAEGEDDCGGSRAYNYYSGEHVTGFKQGRPMFVRTPTSSLTLANFVRTNLYASLAVLRIGFDILFKKENVKIEMVYGHGGLFKTKGVAQQILASALNTPVSVMETAGEGGAWGMALLASYMIHKDSRQSLPDYLSRKVFHDTCGSCLQPRPSEVKGFESFMHRYVEGLPIEQAAVDCMTCG